MFSMLGDNDAHALFNIWRLSRLLRLCNIKFSLSISMTKTHMSKKFPCTWKSQCPTTKIQCPTKMSLLPNFTTIKIVHKSIQPPNFSKAMQKIKIPTSSCTNKFSQSQNHNHTNFPRINITYPTKFFPKPKFHTHKIFPSPQIYPCAYPQNFAMSIKQSLHIPINFSLIHHENMHICLTQNFHNVNIPKIQTKIHPTTSFTYIVKIP